jgi:hypothetical protein
VATSLAASFALTKSAGGLTVYWSGEWRDRFGMRPVFVDVGRGAGGVTEGHAVAWFEFRHPRADGGYDTARSAVLTRDRVPGPGGIVTARPLLAVRVAFRRDDEPSWCTKWIHNPYS